MNLSLLRLLRSLRFARHLGWAGLLVACAASVACSSTQNPPPDGFIAATVGGGPACPFASPVSDWLDVGTPTADKPTTVADQGSTGNGTASVQCTVHPSGGGFDINLSISNSASMGGGNVLISSPAGAGAVTTSGGSGITASFYSAVDLGPYSSSSCTITYTYNDMPVPTSIGPPIAAGRIWGHIDCPDVMDSSQNMSGNDGGIEVATCGATADFLFEQCSQ
jgi:hypothetical protein